MIIAYHLNGEEEKANETFFYDISKAKAFGISIAMSLDKRGKNLNFKAERQILKGKQAMNYASSIYSFTFVEFLFCRLKQFFLSVLTGNNNNHIVYASKVYNQS